MTTYRSPLPILHLLNNRVIVVGTGRLDCFFTDRREIKIGNESCRLLWVCAEKDVTDTDVPLIDSKLTEGMETLRDGERQNNYGSIACIPSAAHSAALSNSMNDVYDAMLFPRVASTTRCRMGLCGFDSAPSTNFRWLETRIGTC